MRAGRLNKTIRLKRVTYAVNAAGTPVETWHDHRDVRAELVETSTEEFLRNYGQTAEAVTVFRTRWFADVTTHDRIVFDCRDHDIKDIKEIGRRDGLEFRTVARNL